jgi:hypothetical protein
MKKMDVSGLAQLAEIVAAIGVIVSLIYVGIELQQNTIAARATTAQAIIDSSRNFLMDIAMNEEMSQIRMLGQEDRSQLNEVELHKFGIYSRGNWLYFQNVWVQWSLGVVDDRIWHTVSGIICEIQAWPGNREEWQEHKGILDPAFVAIVDRCEPD